MPVSLYAIYAQTVEMGCPNQQNQKHGLNQQMELINRNSFGKTYGNSLT